MKWFKGREPARSIFASLLDEARSGECTLCISRVNLGEVFHHTAIDHGSSLAEPLIQEIRRLPIEIVSISDVQVDEAARLKSRYRISYADGFAAWLSITREAPLLTGDMDFRALEADGLLRLHWVGR